MFELILAAAEQVNQPTTLQTWGPWGAVIVALGGKEGIMALMGSIRKRNSKPCKPVPSARMVCPAHDGLIKLLDERKKVFEGKFEDIKESMATIRTETRENFHSVFDKLDRLQRA